jgi:hypothetical protein
MNANASTQPTSRLFVALLLLLFAALSVRYSFKVLDNRSAFTRWQPQVLDIEHGTDLSARYNYPNPPIMAVLLEPFALLPPLVGALVWYYLKVGLALLSLVWVFRLVEEPERPLPTWARGLIVLVALKPIIDDLTHGNVNLFILFLIVAALFAFRQRRDLLAGVVLALAIACKLTPALFIPYFLWKRAWKTVAGVVLGLMLFLWPGVVPALRLGFEDNQRQLLSWYHGMVEPFVFEGKVTSEHSNQSLPGLLARLTTHSPSFSTWIDDRYTPTRYDNFATLDPTVTRWLVKGVLVLFGVLIVCTCRTPTEPRWRLGLAAEFGVILLGMLLFSERTWKHHAVTLVVPIAVLCAGAANRSFSRGLRTGWLCCLVVAFALVLATGLGMGRDDPWGAVPAAKLAQVYGAYTLAFLVLLVGLAALLLHRPSPGAAAPGQPVRAAA